MLKHNKLLDFITSCKGWALIAISQFVSLSGTGKGIVALISVFMVDFITGCIASWIEHKASDNKVKVYFIESAKIRKSIVKACGYMVFIFLAWVLTILYFDKIINIPYSTKDLTIVQIIIGICVAIEAWSNVENFKRMGFDMVGKITSLAKAGWELFRTIKTGKNEE